MPWLYHKYAGHDINRDAFMMNMAENRNLARFFYTKWHPQVFLTMHQMETNGPRFFVPPNADPIDPNYDPLIWREAALLGERDGARAAARRRSGRRVERDVRLLLARLRGLGAARPQHGLPADRGGERQRRDADHRARRASCAAAIKGAARLQPADQFSGSVARRHAGRCATSSTTT